MKAFADLLERLVYTRSRNSKLELIARYLKATPDPDRGWALAALTGELRLPAVQPSIIRALVEQRVDPVLFAMSHDYVGDLAETVALIWPQPEVPPAAPEDPALSVIVARLQSLTRQQALNCCWQQTHAHLFQRDS